MRSNNSRLFKGTLLVRENSLIWLHTSRRIVEQSLELYTCSAGAADSEAPDLARNGTQPHAYNELATLMSVTGAPTCARSLLRILSTTIYFTRCAVESPLCPPSSFDHFLRKTAGWAIIYHSVLAPMCWLHTRCCRRCTRKQLQWSGRVSRYCRLGNVLTTCHPKEIKLHAVKCCTTGEDAIKHLLSRGTHREFGYAALLCMLGVYFAGAVWAAGSAIASGLFVPMLLIGSCVGRIVGLIAVDIAAVGGHGSLGCAPRAPPPCVASSGIFHGGLGAATGPPCAPSTPLP